MDIWRPAGALNTEVPLHTWAIPRALQARNPGQKLRCRRAIRLDSTAVENHGELPAVLGEKYYAPGEE
jgi:hypothetical protein